MDRDRVITQLSIFVNNDPGRLAQVSKVLRETGINMKAFNLAESQEFGILRAIVDDPEESYEKLRSKGIIVRKTDVLGIKIDDAPGSLVEASDAFGKEGVNIEYGYAYTGRKASAFFIRVNDLDKAIAILEREGIATLNSSEI
ncbi:MAG: amino acid-binding protein [Candidatus Methanomethylophilaceae archaeon]|nr:amino acid-binding protein [Candidatus Methanomethylophilaceae archaeon]